MNLFFSLNKKEKLSYTKFFFAMNVWKVMIFCMNVTFLRVWTVTQNKLLTPYYICRKILIPKSHCVFQQGKHVISRQWLDFSHWWMCLFRDIVNNSLVRYWRASTFNFLGLSNFQGEGVGMYIFRSLTNHPFIFFCSHLLDVSSKIVPHASTSTTPWGNGDTVHISL